MKNKIIENFLNSIYDNVEIVIPVSAAIIIRKNKESERDEILLIQRSKDDKWPLYWEIIRGKCDHGKNENIINCLKREVKEEVGLDIIPIKLIEKFSYVADEGKRKSIQHNYLCKMKDENQQVVLSHEHSQYKWVSTLAEVQLMVIPELFKCISKVFDNDNITDYTQEKNIEEKLNLYFNNLLLKGNK